MLQRLEAWDLLLEALTPKRTPLPGVPAVWSQRPVGFWKGWVEMSGWTTLERLFGTRSRKIPFSTERIWWLTHQYHSQEWVSLPTQCQHACGSLESGPVWIRHCVYWHNTEVCQSLSRVWLFAIPWPVTHQAPLSMGFSRQDYWSRLPSLLQGIFRTPGTSLQADSLPSKSPGKPILSYSI